MPQSVGVTVGGDDPATDHDPRAHWHSGIRDSLRPLLRPAPSESALAAPPHQRPARFWVLCLVCILPLRTYDSALCRSPARLRLSAGV